MELQPHGIPILAPQWSPPFCTVMLRRKARGDDVTLILVPISMLAPCPRLSCAYEQISCADQR
jgi:hypothetical protein